MKRLFYTLVVSLLCCSSALAHDLSESQTLDLDNAEKKVMKFVERGLEPKEIRLRSLDGSVFFVNSTKDSLVTMRVDFQGHDAHCASANMAFKDGIMQSRAPIAPKDFAIMCFPGKGEYIVSAYGIGGSEKVTQAKIIVE